MAMALAIGYRERSVDWDVTGEFGCRASGAGAINGAIDLELLMITGADGAVADDACLTMAGSMMWSDLEPAIIGTALPRSWAADWRWSPNRPLKAPALYETNPATSAMELAIAATLSSAMLAFITRDSFASCA
jgi:hypothetical protein